jgi:dimethylamine--corrinoid protein Co-methyltransferase
MAITHAIASGMGGMRTAGDLVARVQMSRGMRTEEAKTYVADKLGISTLELVDPIIMSEIREEFDIGLVTPLPKRAGGIEAKFRIADVLGVEINCVKRFREKSGMG